MQRGRRSAVPASAWSVNDLAAAYSQHSNALIRRALRYLQDQQRAEDVVQEAFIKVMLAAPELNDVDHLIAYLNTTVTNLCLDIRRAENRGPLLVAVDADTTQEVLDDLSLDAANEIDAALVQAEDAAIVREAISRLSESDRAVLLNVHILQKSTAETAAEFGVTEGTVRNALMRARRNLRTVLEEWVIDEATGMTAAQALSRTGRKFAENGKKIGSAALSLVLLISAFFGFWNNPVVSDPVASAPVVVDVPPTTSVAPSPSASPSVSSSGGAGAADATVGVPQELLQWGLNLLVRTGPLGWPGLDGAGVPQGFTVNDGSGFAGLALLSETPFKANMNSGVITSSSRLTTFQDGKNVILAQSMSYSNGRLTYKPEPLVRVGGAWLALELADVTTEVKALEDGTFLITSWMVVDIDKTAANQPIAGIGVGSDFQNIPAVVATRIHTTEIGQPIFGQAVQVLDPLAGK